MIIAEKFNIIELEKHHKAFCTGEDCPISLTLLRITAERAGIIFSEKESEVFI